MCERLSGEKYPNSERQLCVDSWGCITMEKHFENPAFVKALELRRKEINGRKMTLAEVEKHKALNDMYIIIRNCVFDVTRYAEIHPGGRLVLLRNAGQDATADFVDTKHSLDAVLKLPPLLVADLAPPTIAPAQVAATRTSKEAMPRPPGIQIPSDHSSDHVPSSTAPSKDIPKATGVQDNSPAVHTTPGINKKTPTPIVMSRGPVTDMVFLRPPPEKSPPLRNPLASPPPPPSDSTRPTEPKSAKQSTGKSNRDISSVLSFLPSPDPVKSSGFLDVGLSSPRAHENDKPKTLPGSLLLTPTALSGTGRNSGLTPRLMVGNHPDDREYLPLRPGALADKEQAHSPLLGPKTAHLHAVVDFPLGLPSPTEALVPAGERPSSLLRTGPGTRTAEKNYPRAFDENQYSRDIVHETRQLPPNLPSALDKNTDPVQESQHANLKPFERFTNSFDSTIRGEISINTPQKLERPKSSATASASSIQAQRPSSPPPRSPFMAPRSDSASKLHVMEGVAEMGGSFKPTHLDNLQSETEQEDSAEETEQPRAKKGVQAYTGVVTGVSLSGSSSDYTSEDEIGIIPRLGGARRDGIAPPGARISGDIKGRGSPLPWTDRTCELAWLFFVFGDEGCAFV